MLPLHALPKNPNHSQGAKSVRGPIQSPSYYNYQVPPRNSSIETGSGIIHNQSTDKLNSVPPYSMDYYPNDQPNRNQQLYYQKY